MPNLSIKDVPAEIVARLRERAARNHRSLQGELMALISAAVTPDQADGAAADKPTRPAAAGPPGRSAITKSVDQIALEHRARFPAPLRQGPSAVDIVRAERDARR